MLEIKDVTGNTLKIGDKVLVPMVITGALFADAYVQVQGKLYYSAPITGTQAPIEVYALQVIKDK